MIGAGGTGDGYEEATVISLTPAWPLKAGNLPLPLLIVCYKIRPLGQSFSQSPARSTSFERALRDNTLGNRPQEVHLKTILC